MEQLLDVAEKAARRYARRCWWADKDDLYQEASIAALRAERTWDPTVGVRLQAYAWRACILHLRNYLWRQSSPVSETDHNLTNLRGVHSTALHAPIACRTGHKLVEELLVDPLPAAPELFDEEKWKARVRDQVKHVLEARQGEYVAGLSVAVLLDERAPKEVAAEAGIEPGRMHRLTQRARAALQENADLYTLLQERKLG